MMVRMIIVDDEHIILDSLKTLIDWNSIGVEVTGTADNGAAAIDLAIKQRPDIILSDISMPYFSGLEMLETLRRNSITTEVIFITAYGKFEYAQEAIHYGAFDYILKPINEELLLSTVSRCAGKIRTWQNRQTTEEQQHVNDLILTCLLRGKAPEKTEWDLIAIHGPDPEKFPYAVVVGFNPGNEEAPNPVSPDLRSVWVSNRLKAAGDLSLLMICFPDKSGTEWSGIIDKLIRGNTEAVTAISTVAAQKDCFERAYAQISFTLIDAQVNGKKGKVYFATTGKSAALSFPGFDSVYSSLSRGIREGGTELIPGLLFKFFAGFLEKEILYDSSLVELYCIELADFIYGENEEYMAHSEAGEKIPAIMVIKKRLTACPGLFHVFAALCEIFAGLSGNINKDQIHSSIRLVRQCIRIIQEHYGEAITLPVAAQQLYISPNYLSRIFSAEMGKSFSRYLLEYRITMAQKLLRESNDKVYEIAAQVGYDDVVHFSKIFKQVTGLSPNRYRNAKP